MLTKDDLRKIADKQRNAESARPEGLLRNVDVNDVILNSHALVITGVRRCGKSTVMTQRIRHLDRPWFYMKFDAPQLVSFDLRDSDRFSDIVAETSARDLFLDEIHEVDGWELIVLAMLDEGRRVCVTGSNASLLKGERAGKLTGRHVSLELFPFSLDEYIRFTGKAPDTSAVEDYLREGGFPRYVETKEEAHLMELFDDIVYRDVIIRHGIRETGAVVRLATWLSENPGCRFSATRLLATLGVSNASTVTQWCDWLEDAYLFFFVPKYCDSVRAQMTNPRKAYCVDTGLLQAVSTRLLFNDALRFENMVFLSLRRQFKEIYYYDDGAECDFIAARRHRAMMAVQSCVELNSDCLDREMVGLRSAMAKFGLKEGWIVTMSQTDRFDVAEGIVHVTPFADFLKAAT